MNGKPIPFRVDYRLWSGGRARGITQKETLNEGYIHPSLYGAWRSFVGKIEASYEAVKEVVYRTPVLEKVYVSQVLTKLYDTPRLVRAIE